ncbi:MAG: phosphoglycerate kinase [Caldisericaceae bacterium]|nr:phosphoglycerate kinase [Caldisericaceae bacterium]
MRKKGLKDVDVREKRVLVRVDFNVPLSPDGDILDDFRIKAEIPTINYLRKNNAKVILMSHLGRPKGKVVKKLRMDSVAKELSKLLGIPVKKLDDCIGEEVEKAIVDADYGDVLLLENLRFYRGETENDNEFAKKLSLLADIYVNDAFATAHRMAASNVGVTAFLPSVAGFLMEKEIVVLSKLLSDPEHPFVGILGGAKVSDKIGVINNLMNTVDEFLIGGGMSFTFLRANGYSIGYSLCEENAISAARQILENAKKNNVKITLPADVLSVPEVKENAPARIVDIEEIPKSGIGVDIGPKTAKIFKKKIQDAKTIVWNGPVGVFEIEAFAKGTYEVARFLGTLKDKTIVAGGGETAVTLRKFGVDKQITHVSTGGGAFLKFLEGHSLPAIEAIENKN